MSETWMSSFSQRIKPFYLSTNHDIEKIFQEAKRRLELTSGSGQQPMLGPSPRKFSRLKTHSSNRSRKLMSMMCCCFKGMSLTKLLYLPLNPSLQRSVHCQNHRLCYTGYHQVFQTNRSLYGFNLFLVQ